MDFEAVSRDLVRALRGKRSQPWLCRRLGLRSNLVYRWEAGRAFPSAQQFFRICRVTHATGLLDLKRFSAGAERLDLETSAGVAAFLQQLAGVESIARLAERIGQSRFVVSRWLSQKTLIRLPDLLAFVAATSRRVLDFCAVFVNPEGLPSVARDFGRLQAARRAAYDVPWSHGVLRALELEDYAKVTGPTEAWLARRLGITRTEVDRALQALKESGQVVLRRGRYAARQVGLIDTGVDRERRQALRSFWTRVALERLEQGAPGIHAFNLFSVAARDVPQIEAWHSELFERIRTLVAESEPAERTLLYSAQILRIDQDVA
jgi:transcriptional regulator with XRE-family HTH domain